VKEDISENPARGVPDDKSLVDSSGRRKLCKWNDSCERSFVTDPITIQIVQSIFRSLANVSGSAVVSSTNCSTNDMVSRWERQKMIGAWHKCRDKPLN
jgi:hypothetical protein